MHHTTDMPNNIKNSYLEISGLTDIFCLGYLSKKYVHASRTMVSQLCQSHISLVKPCKTKYWAAGTIHALAKTNQLYATETIPHVPASKVIDEFEISRSTIYKYANLIQQLINVPCFQVPQNHQQQSQATLSQWLISIDGIIIDAREMPHDIQKEAYQKGSIPHLPRNQLSTNTTSKSIFGL